MNLDDKNNTAYSEEKYGMARVIEPKFVLPTSAWSLDNNREISSRELRVSIRKIHLETTNFKQLQLECGDDDSKIKEKIIDIVIRRGKLHNPMTDTAGVLYGVVDEIGSEYVNEHGLKKGDEIICNLSLASIPLYISRITSISLPYSQIVAEGYAILYQGMPVIRVPEDAPIDLLLLMLDESGTLMTASQKAQGKNNILVVGNNIMVNMIYGYALRRVAGPNAEIVCLLDKRMTVHADGPATSNLLSEIFSELHYVDILRPIECMRRLDQESFFDMSVNCADIPGAETINILATKEGGTVIFANLINNYNISIYITEASSKHLELLSAVGYIEGYEDYDILLSRELAPAFDAMEFTVLRGSERNLFRASSKETRLLDSMARITTLAEDFICDSRAMQAILEEVTAVSKYDCNVFITGDTGVGKEKVANIIQKNSSRKIQPFIKVNCAAISPTLIESELFGYEKGAFTGASSSGKKGYFELADNGTIFLDEVGELPLDIQAKLLRVIQDGEFYKVGATKPTKINVRIICATNRNVEKMVEEKQFRRDLYYRLNVFPIRIPGLSDRKEDIPGLVHLFLSKYGELFHVTRDISEDAMEYLTNHEWPGNIRELENVMQRLLINARGETILLYDVTKELNQDLFDKEITQKPLIGVPDTESELSLTEMLEEYEKGIIKYACEKYGSTRKAAKAIGISQTQLVRKKNKYDIDC